MVNFKNVEGKMRVCIIGAGDGGATAANQVRRLDSEVQIDVFSKREVLGCPPCEMPLIIGEAIATWDELIRGFCQNSFWEKRSINLHLNTEVTGHRQGRKIHRCRSEEI